MKRFTPIQSVRRLLQRDFSAAALLLLFGAMMSATLFLWLTVDHEERILQGILDNAVHSAMSTEEKALALNETVHTLLQPRTEFFKERVQTRLRDQVFSTTRDLVAAPGACGSYTGLLIRLLKRAGIPARLAQMDCAEGPACHIYTEANVGGKWVVLDALYNLSFRTADGSLASFDEVRAGWENYRKSLPEDYNPMYRYEGVRYTNWNKIPVLLPALKRVLILVFGEQIEEFSLRPYLMQPARVLLRLLVPLEAGVLVLLAGAFRLRRSSKIC